MKEYTIELSDEAAEFLRAYQEKGGSFAELVEGLINMAAPYGPPDFESDVEIARLRLGIPHSQK